MIFVKGFRVGLKRGSGGVVTIGLIAGFIVLSRCVKGQTFLKQKRKKMAERKKSLAS